MTSPHTTINLELPNRTHIAVSFRFGDFPYDYLRDMMVSSVFEALLRLLEHERSGMTEYGEKMRILKAFHAAAPMAAIQFMSEKKP